MIAGEVWRRFGVVQNYVEPFAGSLAVLLARPKPYHIEAVNDLDGLLVNFWRAVKFSPDEVAYWADYPVTSIDMMARHNHIQARRDEVKAALMADPDYCDAKIAGWWVYVKSAIIGSSAREETINLRVPYMSSQGMGVHSGAVKDRIPQVMAALSERLKYTKIICGDWSSIVTPAVTSGCGLHNCGIFLDPPYFDYDNHDSGLYTHDDDNVAVEARNWAIENGDNPLLRIALCGYDGEHDMPDTWLTVEWKASRGYSRTGNENRHRERIYFSPHCLNPQPELFQL